MEHAVAAAMKELAEGWVELETVGGACKEVEGADFGDQRLSKRYGKVLEQMMKMPQAPFTQSSECLSQMHAAYRFVSNSKVTVEKLLEPHRAQLARRAEGEPLVLAIQDSTQFDLCDHLSVEGLAPSGVGKLSRSMWVHTTLFILPNGLPIGVADVQSYSGKKPYKDKSVRADKPMRDKLSGRWLEAVSNCEALVAKETRVVWLSDRESDIYELLQHIQGVRHEFVIRARVSRGIEEGPHYDTERALKDAPVVRRYEAEVSRNFKRAERVAQMELRYIKATISVPVSRKKFTTESTVRAYVVEAREVGAPEGVEPLHWRLLTNLPVNSADDAAEIVRLYSKRWAIEEIFKILKSGCRAEKAQFQTMERLTKYATLSLIVAWRIYYLVHVNRVAPNAPARSVTTKTELDTLQMLLDAKRQSMKKRRIIIKTAQQVITQVAMLGGYLDRKNDCPGTVVLWRGTMALAVATMTFLALRPASKSALM